MKYFAFWNENPNGSLDIMRGTSPIEFLKIGESLGKEYRDPGALNSPDKFYYKINGPCNGY